MLTPVLAWRDLIKPRETYVRLTGIRTEIWTLDPRIWRRNANRPAHLRISISTCLSKYVKLWKYFWFLSPDSARQMKQTSKQAAHRSLKSRTVTHQFVWRVALNANTSGLDTHRRAGPTADHRLTPSLRYTVYSTDPCTKCKKLKQDGEVAFAGLCSVLIPETTERVSMDLVDSRCLNPLSWKFPSCVNCCSCRGNTNHKFYASLTL